MPHNKISEVQGDERVRFSVPENQLVSLLLARRNETQVGISTLDRRGAARSLSYAGLYQKAAQLCAGLQQAGLRPGDRLVLQLDDALDVITAFWGCILAGVVPVPLNPAPSYQRPNGQTERLCSAVVRFRCRAILASAESCAAIAALLAREALNSCAVLDLQQCLAVSAAPVIHTPAPDDAAAMFLTSGSTGAAKGVVQTHAAMLAMADATIQMNGFGADDVTLNWMSLDHAGSLVFLGVMPLALGARQVHVPIDYVLKEPSRWLDLIEHWRASITWAPNFVFSLLLDRRAQLESRHWDLSCMRFMVNAGEAVVSATARRFIALLQQFGLPEGALRPAFGMVETNSGITWSRGFRLEDTADSDQFVALGPVIPGAAMKIVDESGATVAEGEEGRLLLRGPSVFKGYEGEEQLNATMLLDGWLVSGDLAYIKEGQLYVTGREKDMVIINGNNHYCHEIEAVVGKSALVASDCVAATGVRANGEDTESLVIFYALANAAGSAVDKHDLEKTLRAEVSRATGLAPKAFVALQPQEFPRTEIGKIKRSVLKRRYEAGEFSANTDAATPMANTRRSPFAADSGSARYRELLQDIAAIWRRVLKLDAVGLDDTFFELGGSSLLAIQVQHELEQLLGREVSMVELFDTPSIRSMATHFSGAQAPAQQQELTNQDGRHTTGDIAVIGIGCRFPGAHGPAAFWRVLEEGVETITFFEPELAIAAGVPPERARDPAQVNAAPILDDIEGCDLDFWHYTRREASLLDPQQRVFLETAWEAFEDAGYVPGSALGRVGVYASAATNTYLQNNVYANSAWVAGNGGDLFTVNSLDGFNVMVANDKDYLPTRVSYKLDLTGPSMAVQTACSSTLVAIHEAVRALRQGECDLALAGGCALMLPQHAGHYYDEGMINSLDGHCRAYDADAKGTIFGSGSGAVVLKRLEQAQQDGDAIYAVIKGSAVVNDGGQKMGFAAPSMLGEYRAISQAIQDAGIDADSIGFVEGHGTGTPIGDPIEVEALTRAFRHSTQRNGYCALGSVKTNIGHMGIASGIAGFIKTVLALQHKTLPATLHFKTPNPAIAFDKTPFYVSNRSTAWPTDTLPRRAGVNSLGIGGTNVHVILEEAPAPLHTSGRQDINVLPMSAGTESALQASITALANFVVRHPDVELADICFTQQRGRLAMACRRAFVVKDREDLLSQLRATSPVVDRANGKARVVFMFTGQGSQYLGMGRALHASYPVFREAFDACTALFDHWREHSLRELVLSAADDADAAALLDQTLYTQPALFCLQVALVQLYRQLGVEPDLIVGHSIGEVAGVWAAGGLSLEDAATLVEVRSRLMQAVNSAGAMASVKAPADVVLALLRDGAVDCEIAACNSPLDTTLTGDVDAIATACSLLQQHQLEVTPLKVSHAFHSRHMETVQQQFADAIAALDFRSTNMPVLCNVNATELDHVGEGAAYWSKQLRAPVQFMQALQQALARGGNCFVEIGPAAVLCSLGRTLDQDGAAQWIPSLRKSQDDEQVFASALAALFTLGHDIEWSATPFAGNRMHLPTYPWQRQRCWIDADAPQLRAAPGQDPLLAPPLVLPRLGQQLYTLDYATDTIPVLAQHRVFGVLVPPAALYVSQLLRTAADFSGQSTVVLHDVNFVAPLRIGDAGTGSDRKTVQIVYASSGGLTSIELSSQPAALRLSAAGSDREESAVQVHVTAELQAATSSDSATVDLAAIRRRCQQPLQPRVIEAHMQAKQVELGESFLCFRSISRGDNEALALLDVPIGAVARIGQGIPAGLLDCHWQTLLAALPSLPNVTVVPARIETLLCREQPLPEQVWAHAQLQQHSPTHIVANVSLLTSAGEVLLESRGIELRAVDARSFRQAESLPRLFTRRWDSFTLDGGGRAAVQGVYLAGNAGDVQRLAAQLRQLGLQAELVEATQVARLGGGRSARPLIYVDRCTQATADSCLRSCGALNRLLSTLESREVAIDRILVVTGLTDSAANVGSAQVASLLAVAASAGTAAVAAANRAALAVQAVSAAHELTARHICAVEMDEETSSLQALRALLGTALESGLRLRISAGEVQSLKAELQAPASPQVSFSPEKLQVLTGALGGLGQLTLQWMFQRGARRFLLASRTAPSTAAQATLAVLREQGASIEVQRCDVSEYAQVRALADKAARSGPVETLIHAAGARRDGLIASLHDEDFSALAQAKVVGAVNLQQAFQPLKPKHIVYYASIAGWLGAAGQSNYAAANAALDSVAAHQAAAGSAVVSVAWGPWGKTGMMSSLSEAQLARIGRTGYGFLDSEGAFNLLGRWLATSNSGELCIMTGDTDKLAALPGAASFWSALEQGRRKSAKVQVAPVVPRLPPLAEQLIALERKGANELLLDHLTRLVADMTNNSRAASIDIEAGLLDLGIDSLAALELRKKLEAALGLKLKSTLILDYPRIADLAQALVQQLRKAHAPTVEQPVKPAQDHSSRADLLRQLANEIDFQEQA